MKTNKLIEESVKQAMYRFLNEGLEGMLSKEVLKILSKNALDNLGGGDKLHSDLLDVDEDEHEINLGNGCTIKYEIIDPETDKIDWQLFDEDGEIMSVNDDETFEHITNELLDLLVSEVPYEYRHEDDDEIAGQDDEDEHFDKMASERMDKPEHIKMQDGEDFLSEDINAGDVFDEVKNNKEAAELAKQLMSDPEFLRMLVAKVFETVGPGRAINSFKNFLAGVREDGILAGIKKANEYKDAQSKHQRAVIIQMIKDNPKLMFKMARMILRAAGAAALFADDATVVGVADDGAAIKLAELSAKDLVELGIAYTKAEAKLMGKDLNQSEPSDEEYDNMASDVQDGPEHTKMQDGEGFLAEGKGRTQTILDNNPQIVDMALKGLLSHEPGYNYGWDKILKGIKEDLCYYLDQHGVMSVSAQRDIASEAIAIATEKARERGYRGPVWLTADAQKDAKSERDEYLYNSYRLSNFFDFLKEQGYYSDFIGFEVKYIESVARYLFDKNERNGKKAAMCSLYHFYCQFIGRRLNNYYTYDTSVIPRDELDVLKIFMKRHSKDFKEAYKEYLRKESEAKEKKEAEKQDSSNEPEQNEVSSEVELVRESFYCMLDRINGKKLF